MRAKVLILAAAILLTGCAVFRGQEIVKVALLAPFEGRYREIGYNALYAARLALADYAAGEIVLLAVDDGGGESSAKERARALALDPDVKMALLLGPYSVDEGVQQILDSIPLLMIGYWGAVPAHDLAYLLANSTIGDEVDQASFDILQAAEISGALSGYEILALEQFVRLRGSSEGISIISSASLPDADFRQRYLSSDLFVPEPGLLATLTYDAAGIAIQALQTGQSLEGMEFAGRNGIILLKQRYWSNAPIHRYTYSEEGMLIPASTP